MQPASSPKYGARRAERPDVAAVSATVKQQAAISGSNIGENERQHNGTVAVFYVSPSRSMEHAYILRSKQSSDRNDATVLHYIACCLRYFMVPYVIISHENLLQLILGLLFVWFSL